MDGHRFDELTKALAAGGVSRRGVLRGLFGSAIGGVLAAVGFGDVAAQAIQCDRGEVRCRDDSDEYCADLRSNRFNCGRCGRVCMSHEVCYAGRCMSTCPSGFVACSGTCARECACDGVFEQFCNGVCTDTFIDTNNCGACGNVCEPDEDCKFGECEPSSTTFSASPISVWQALTSPRALASWGMENTVEPRVGHRFELRATPRAGYDGVMEGEVLELDVPRRIVFAWRGGPLVEPAVVTITLEPIPEGTRLRLTQESGTDAPCAAAALMLGQNWQRRLFGGALPRYLDAQRRPNPFER